MSAVTLPTLRDLQFPEGAPACGPAHFSCLTTRSSPSLSVNARISQPTTVPTCREEGRVMASKGASALLPRSGKDNARPALQSSSGRLK
jgi:hypothetical protein